MLNNLFVDKLLIRINIINKRSIMSIILFFICMHTGHFLSGVYFGLIRVSFCIIIMLWIYL